MKKEERVASRDFMGFDTSRLKVLLHSRLVERIWYMRNCVTIRRYLRKLFIFIKNSGITSESSCYNMTELGELSSFIEFLKDELGFNFYVHSFSHRFKLQKYVFLAKFFGWNNNYSYNVYLRGPYSKGLADDYYKIENGELAPLVILTTFDTTSFLHLIDGKEDFWLESAATIISIMSNYRRYYHGEELKKKVLERVMDLKDHIPNELIEEAFLDLSNAGILPNN
jgi:uncharacterized protein YwgA